MRHSKLTKRRAELITKGQNTPVVAPCGQYSYESSLVMRVCEAQDIMEESAAILEGIARGYGFGDEYDRICDLLEKLNIYHEKKNKMLATGKDWGVADESANRKVKIGTPLLGGGVFGKSWAEIEKMQGGKITVKY